MSDRRAERRERTATESLLAVALALEAFLVFFVTLTVFGLRALEPVPAFVGGGALLVALVLTARLVRYRWGVAIGWLLQAVLVATGILLPIMFAIGGAFAGIWTYCFVKGRQLDAAKRRFLAENDPVPTSNDPTSAEPTAEPTIEPTTEQGDHS